MKRTVKDIIGFAIGATDGEIGNVKEFYFDDHTWTIRYLVVETGSWLSGRKVLISPEALLKPNWDEEIFPVKLTMEQVKNSPDIDTDKPVSRQHEIDLYQHYPWTSYWGGGLWAGGMGTTGMVLPHVEPFIDAIHTSELSGEGKENGDPHLQSTAKVKGYSIHAADGDVGEVEDFIIDDINWKIDYIVVDTGNWFPGKKVLISPRWIKQIEWETAMVVVDATVESIKNSPPFDHSEPISDDYQRNLHDHYGKTTY